MLASATIANAGAAGRVARRRAGHGDRERRRSAHRADDRALEPELLDPELGVRASALGDASRLLAAFVERGLRTICFAKSRKAVELIHRFAADRLEPALAARIAPYRAGYTPSQRREIEGRLMAGELLGVTATDALELGIDIGTLDCAISVGFPGTVSSLRQQWGRAGAQPGARRARRERTPSTSTSCASPRRCSPGRSRRRCSTTRTRACSTATFSPRRSKGRSTRPTRRRSARRRSSGPRCCPS